MTGPLRNVFACLVHERQESVIDLVHNLHVLDPESPILLYNGGDDARLLAGFPFERYGAEVVPGARPMAWGWLHPFALDCMAFALDHVAFDTLTIVDSDQLAVRGGYSRYLARFPFDCRTGMLGSSPAVETAATAVAPARAAHQERELWVPLLRCFAGGEEKFVHWTYWPSTVFFHDACRDLVETFAHHRQLRELLGRTGAWASEEIILPTLVALLGYEIALNPCSYEYVRYQASYAPEQVERALSLPDVYWLHPVPRPYQDGLRVLLRRHTAGLQAAAVARRQVEHCTVPAWPVLHKMREIRGWLEPAEAEMLMAAVEHALASLPQPISVVEVGSYCGRSTAALASVTAAVRPGAAVHAVDPHSGEVGALDGTIERGSGTREELQRNLEQWGLARVVRVVPRASYEVDWDQPIGFLFVDGLHDYANVARDFLHFEPWLVAGGLAAFHDYAAYYPGVQQLVDELLQERAFRLIGRAASLIVLEKRAPAAGSLAAGCPAAPPAAPEHRPRRHWPLVSCILPTYARPAFMAQAVRYFLRQDYPARELIVIDDGGAPARQLLPADPRIHYVHLPARHSVGSKRNIACDLAHGEIIAHWDDDDWSAPWRLSYQLEELLRLRFKAICGLAQVRFYSPLASAAWRYVYPAAERPWVHGGTLCYYRALWQAQPFLDLSEGEDNAFVWSAPAEEIAALGDDSFYVGLVHPGNSSEKRTDGSRWCPYPEALVRRQLGEDMDFYDRLRSESARREAAPAPSPHGSLR
jgi:predicted O-methyltransferase YrrM